MIPNLYGRGVFVFSDPGGAKPILAFLKLNQQIKDYIVVSDRVFDFYPDFEIPVTLYEENYETTLLENFKPDFIMTGTSINSKIELKFLAQSKKLGIDSYSFIDHYTNYNLRYELGDEHVFSDYVCLIDEKAEEIAKNSIIPSKRLVTGNYYHHYLKTWRPSVSKVEFFNQHNLPIDRTLILYAPDPVSRYEGKNLYGFDEYSVLLNLIRVLETKPDRFSFMIKMHPNQDKDRLSSFAKENGSFPIMIADQISTNTLLHYSDLVIGMFSNILIEASLLKAPVARCLIDLKCLDPLNHLNVGSIITNESELVDVINRSLK